MEMLITGASSGIGAATARAAGRSGWDVVLTGRRRDRLEAVAEEVRALGRRADVLVFDVRDREAVLEAISGHYGAAAGPDVLVNNAGLAVGREAVDVGAFEDWDRMIDTNVRGLLHVTRAVAPRMREGGRIVNVGSIAGRQAYPGGAVYNATKFAVDGLTAALRMDLLPRGIQVLQILPGAAETEFSEVRFKGDRDAAAQVYAGFEPLRPDDIAEALLFMVERPGRVCVQDLVITPSAQATSMVIRKDPTFAS
jgi:hypothetical protein